MTTPVMPSTPVPMVALTRLFQATWAGRIPDVQAGSSFWARYADRPGLISGGLARDWADGDAALPPREPPHTVRGISGAAAGTSNNSPGVGLLPVAGPPPAPRQN